ncbi:MAG: hypothetical protein HYY84_09525 [Deltaproteobacteria bacterium]|nr:hypothetical protein [Deltaproteobacteria bacterium]
MQFHGDARYHRARVEFNAGACYFAVMFTLGVAILFFDLDLALAKVQAPASARRGARVAARANDETPRNEDPGDEQPDDAIDKASVAYDAVAKLFAEGNFSAAMREVRKARAIYPSSAILQYMDGRLLFLTGDASRGLKELEAAAKVLVAEPDLHWVLGLARKQLGDRKGARAAFNVALKLDPEHAETRNELNEIDQFERIVANDLREPAKGTAAAVVAEFIGLVRRGEWAAAVDRCVDERLMRGLFGRNDPKPKDRADVLKGFMKGVQTKMANDSHFEFLGIEVDEKQTEDGDGAVSVKVAIAAKMTATERSVEKMKALFKSSLADQHVGSDMLRLVRGLEDADRESYFKRLVGQQSNSVLPLRFKLQKNRQGAWRITDVGTREPWAVVMSISDFAQNRAAFQALSAPRGSAASSLATNEAGDSLVHIVLAGIGVAWFVGVAWLIVRERRRARREREFVPPESLPPHDPPPGQ